MYERKGEQYYLSIVAGEKGKRSSGVDGQESLGVENGERRILDERRGGGHVYVRRDLGTLEMGGKEGESQKRDHVNNVQGLEAGFRKNEGKNYWEMTVLRGERELVVKGGCRG